MSQQNNINPIEADIERFIINEKLDIEFADSSKSIGLNSSILLVAIGNNAARMVSRVIHQLIKIGISTEYFASIAFVDYDYTELDERINYIKIDLQNIQRNELDGLIVDQKEEIYNGIDSAISKIINIMNKVNANINAFIFADISEVIFSGCPYILSFTKDILTFRPTISINNTGVFLVSAETSSRMVQGRIYSSCREIDFMSSSNFNIEIKLGHFKDDEEYIINQSGTLFDVCYWFSDFDEYSQPVIEGEISIPEMLASLIYLKTSDNCVLNETMMFNALNIFADQPHYATIGYSRKSIKVYPVVCYTCWYILDKMIKSSKQNAAISINWENILDELKINTFGVDNFTSGIFMSPSISVMHNIQGLDLNKDIGKDMLNLLLDDAETILISDSAGNLFKEQVVDVYEKLIEEKLPLIEDIFRNKLIEFLTDSKRGFYYVQRIISNKEGLEDKNLISYLEERVKEFKNKSNQLLEKVKANGLLPLFRHDIIHDQKGFFIFKKAVKNNFLHKLTDVKYRLWTEALIQEKLAVIFEAYLKVCKEFKNDLEKRETTLINILKDLKDIKEDGRKELVANGELGIINLCKKMLDEKYKTDIKDFFSTYYGDKNLDVNEDQYREIFLSDLLLSAKSLLEETDFVRYSLEELLLNMNNMSLNNKSDEMIEDLYSKCRLALTLTPRQDKPLETRYYFFTNRENNQLTQHIRSFFEKKIASSYDFVYFKSSKSLRMVKCLFGFSIQDLFIYRNYKSSYEKFIDQGVDFHCQYFLDNVKCEI